MQPASPQRWQAALRRAIAAGVLIFRISGTDHWVATSASKPGTAYLTDGVSCQCEAAGFGDSVCVHRAAYWAAQGLLTLEPEPETAAVS